MLRLLLVRGADARAVAPGLGTALHAACRYGHAANVDVLLRHDQTSAYATRPVRPDLGLCEIVNSLGERS